MFVLGLQGSPRKKGNSHHLLTTFMTAMQELGAQTEIIDVCRRDIRPCLELVVCEKKGFCPIEDEMQRDIYGLIRRADVIVMASPVFFYSVTAQLKGLIDRCQTLWARKYRLRLKDPKSRQRIGFLLAVGATKGKELFTGLELVAKYFFDAVDADYQGSLTYPGIEGPNDIQQNTDMPAEVKSAAARIMQPFQNRKKILFTCVKGDRLSPMAAAMAQSKAGSYLDVNFAGSTPSSKINPAVIKVMAESGIDMAFWTPQALDDVIGNWTPDIFVGLDCWEACPFLSGAQRENWEISTAVGDDLDELRRLRDEIDQKVTKLIEKLPSVPQKDNR